MSAKNDLAEDRTDWAEDRTILANERTFAGWMRTGMAAVAVAIGMKAVFGAFEPTWVAKAVASIFVVAGVAIFASSARLSCKAQRRIASHSTEPHPVWRLWIIAGVLSAGSIATLGILWLL